MEYTVVTRIWEMQEIETRPQSWWNKEEVDHQSLEAQERSLWGWGLNFWGGTLPNCCDIWVELWAGSECWEGPEARTHGCWRVAPATT